MNRSLESLGFRFEHQDDEYKRYLKLRSELFHERFESRKTHDILEGVNRLMRWIDQEKIELPEGWLDKAAAAKKKMQDEGLKPDDFSDVWRCLKDRFAVLSDKRCWICEAPAARYDNAIDHFRPKSRVAEGKKTMRGTDG